MHEFVHQQNLLRYRKLLAETTNEARHHQLIKLLAEEEHEQKLARSNIEENNVHLSARRRKPGLSGTSIV
jgi:hypothetical protein